MDRFIFLLAIALSRSLSDEGNEPLGMIFDSRYCYGDHAWYIPAQRNNAVLMKRKRVLPNQLHKVKEINYVRNTIITNQE